jgi:hypothetical protein
LTRLDDLYGDIVALLFFERHQRHFVIVYDLTSNSIAIFEVGFKKRKINAKKPVKSFFNILKNIFQMKDAGSRAKNRAG